MNIFKTMFVLISGFAIISCSSPKNNSDDQTEKIIKDVSELTYSDVIKLVFDDEGAGVEWHGEESPNTYKDNIDISANGKCGEDECGNITFITNTHESATLEIIIKADYSIEGDVGYIARMYILEPQKKLRVGCSDLCYNGKSYSFVRSVVASSELLQE